MSAPVAVPMGSRSGRGVRTDVLTVVLCAATVMLATSVVAAVQTAWVQDVALHVGAAVPTLLRLASNVVETAAVSVALVALGVHRRPGLARRLRVVVTAAVAGSLVRVATQWLLGLLAGASFGTWLLQLGAGMPVALLAGGFAVLALRVQLRVRAEADAATRAALARETAMGALADEEVRVRREVAEGLHATAQQRLVLVVAGLDQVLRELDGTAGPDVTGQLRELRDKVEMVRAADIRQASRLLYPHQLEVGLVAAVRALLAELPVSVATHLSVDRAVRALDEPGSCRTTRGERLLVARVVEEAIGNALRHGHATDVAVTLDLVGTGIAVSVADDGSGLTGVGGDGSGLARLADRLALAGGSLTVETRVPHGVVVRAHVPVAELAAPAAGR